MKRAKQNNTPIKPHIDSLYKHYMNYKGIELTFQLFKHMRTPAVDVARVFTKQLADKYVEWLEWERASYMEAGNV